jgi:hypothetical protein
MDTTGYYHGQATHDGHNGHTDHEGAPAATGERTGASSSPRRGKPTWVRLLEDDRIRLLVAAHLSERVTEIRSAAGHDSAEAVTATYLADQLGDVVTALQERG